MEKINTEATNNPLPMHTSETAPETEANIPTLLAIFCDEIKSMEGWFAGSTSFTCNNPGNLRCNPGQMSGWNHLAVGTHNGFCMFKDASTGMQALLNVTRALCEGKSVVYNNAAKHFGLTNGAELNLYQYFLIRDPAQDNNNPNALAERFGKVLGVDPKVFKMKELLN